MREEERETTSDLRRIASLDFTFSKRQVGVVLFVVGGIGLSLLLFWDTLGMGQDAEFGPAQRIGIAIMALVTVAGASLIPFKNKPF